MLPYTCYEDTRFAADPARAGVWREIAAWLQRFVPESGSALELGSGYCDLINSLRAARRWAVDLHIDPARFVAPGVVPLLADAADLGSIVDGDLDAILASNLLEHLGDDKLVEVVRECLRKVKTGGRLILIQPNFALCPRRYYDDYTHCRAFTHVGLADFLRSQGWEIELVRARFLPFSMRSRVPKWPWLVRLYLRLPFKPFAGQMLVVARKPA